MENSAGLGGRIRYFLGRLNDVRRGGVDECQFEPVKQDRIERMRIGVLADLRRRALEAGHDCITCACPLAPYDKIEHLVIPELGLAFTTSNCWHKADFPVYRRIHAARFTDAETLRMKKQVMSFNRRAARELLAAACAPPKRPRRYTTAWRISAARRWIGIKPPH